MSSNLDEKDLKEKLIKNLKKEVKQIMEEAVTRKFVHEESAKLTSLCAAVEMCLAHGLKRRTLGLFKTSSTTALIHKIGKSFAPAGLVSKLMQEIECQDPNRRSNSSGDSISRLSRPIIVKKNSGVVTPQPKYLWIRIALFQKVLAKIIEYLVQNSSKYYEKGALSADPDYGNILSSLSVGPCALDYSRIKTVDHIWTDPPADELVQRHKISSGHLITPATPPQPRRPALHYWKPSGTSGSDDSNSMSIGSFGGALPTPINPARCLSSSAREYVESLHQNYRAALLYGKNNVMVQPKDQSEPMPGYLSLHQSSDGLTIKWSPNHLMNGCCGETENKSVYWEYALNVKVEEIVYVHCHQQHDNGGTIVLVGQDGTQYSPLHFPRGGHLLAFLSCLENGLLPPGQLDPPLWTQKGKGKVFPKLRRKARAMVNGRSLRERPHPITLPRQDENDESTDRPQEDNGFVREEYWDQKQFSEDDETSDFVFRIVTTAKPEKFSHRDLMSPLLKGSSWFQRVPKLSSHSSSTSSSKSFSLADSLCDAIAPPPTPNPISTPTPTPTPAPSLEMLLHEVVALNGDKEVLNGFSDSEKNSDSLELLCSTMKHQIISRAFYGWLAHCRHLRTVRTHLAGLVLPTLSIMSSDKIVHWEEGLTESVWLKLIADGKVNNKEEIRARVYLGGMDHSIRKEVWPYLLEYYEFGSSEEERAELDKEMRQAYESTMSEWLAVEAIVRQRDKETMAMNLAKLSSESHSCDGPAGDEKSLNNEVFEDTESISSLENTIIIPVEEEVVEHIFGKEEQDPSNEDISISKLKTEASLDTNSPTCNVTPEEGIIVEGSEIEIEQNPDYDDSEVVTLEEKLETESEKEGRESSIDKSKMDTLAVDELDENQSDDRPVSPASSNGGIYTNELLEDFGLNIHRIDKDVQRCDRHYWYFNTANLEKLRNIMCTYVWMHRDIGYMQGMCDLVAPLLVVFDDEAMTYACFSQLMTRMAANFPHHGSAMDQNFANMRSLIQILDAEMFELMHQNGDYTHFYFCYRWFLLDFKRELVYDDVFLVWEVIWSARYLSSAHFVLFIALALVQYYRAIILENSMDFTDIIKFFNEMAERHDTKAVLTASRNLVTQLQTLIENK